MNRYAYLAAVLFLAFSCAIAQQQVSNLSSFSQVCLLTNVLTDDKLDSSREAAVLVHMTRFVTDAGIQMLNAAECQSLRFDTTSSTLKVLPETRP